MLDLYLRAADEATIDAALLSAGLIDEEGNPASTLVCIDRIGEIRRVTGYDGDDPIIETLEGWHANLRLLFDPAPEQIEALAAGMIEAPGFPYRVWA
jgi:hypothetical protein